MLFTKINIPNEFVQIWFEAFLCYCWEDVSDVIMSVVMVFCYFVDEFDGLLVEGVQSLIKHILQYRNLLVSQWYIQMQAIDCLDLGHWVEQVVAGNDIFKIIKNDELLFGVVNV